MMIIFRFEKLSIEIFGNILWLFLNAFGGKKNEIRNKKETNLWQKYCL